MYKFLLIEDDKDDREAFKDSLDLLNIEKDDDNFYEVDCAINYKEAIEFLEKRANEYTGIIIDLKLDTPESGDKLIDIIIKKYHVPIIVFTATPGMCTKNVKKYQKGEIKYKDIIKELCDISETGLFNIFKANGILEQSIIDIFWKNLYPYLDLWIEKKNKKIDTEKMLLRYAIAHIQELINEEVPMYETEEMYINPPVVKTLKTGTIVKSLSDNHYMIVLSPPCDLAVHKNKIKTDNILVCEIEKINTVEEKATEGIKNPKKIEKEKLSCKKNNYTTYYHYLPNNVFFEGGYINFRKVHSYNTEQFLEMYDENSYISVQEFFVKNILNRFSSYYSRQGQPDLNI